MATSIVNIGTLRRVMKEFLEWRAEGISERELESYRVVLSAFATCIERKAGPSRVGLELVPFEIDGFLFEFAPEAMPSDARVRRDAPNVVADFCAWLGFMDYVSESAMEKAIDALGARAHTDADPEHDPDSTLNG